MEIVRELDTKVVGRVCGNRGYLKDISRHETGFFGRVHQESTAGAGSRVGGG